MDACDQIAVAVRFLEKGDAAGDLDLSQTAFAAILYHLVVVGEAVRALPADWKGEHPQARWAQAQAMRNVVTHEYYRVNPVTVHETIDEPWAALRGVCASLIIRYR